VAYVQRTVKLGPGDCLTLYTDGITEAMNDTGELYGRRRLWGQLRSGAQGAAAIGRRILEDIKRFVGIQPQSDDICLACFGRVDCGSSAEMSSLARDCPSTWPDQVAGRLAG
jgi:serine phosphatase RsbU (regulator of sigma subunit)